MTLSSYRKWSLQWQIAHGPHSLLQVCDGRGLVQVDISQEDEVQQMVLRACEEFGRLDILINNAARFVFNFVTEITDSGWLLLALAPLYTPDQCLVSSAPPSSHCQQIVLEYCLCRLGESTGYKRQRHSLCHQTCSKGHDKCQGSGLHCQHCLHERLCSSAIICALQHIKRRHPADHPMQCPGPGQRKHQVPGIPP